MSKIVVLGAGLVGRHIAVDLAKNHQVTCVDMNPMRDFFEGTGVIFKKSSIASSNIGDLIIDKDLVVNALPGWLGYHILECSILWGKDVVDISFMPEDPTPLKELAEQHGVRAIVDMGVAPGLCGAMIGWEHNIDSKIIRVKIMVGGLPTDPKAPYYYKAPFEPMGVIAEYTRPVRIRAWGKNKFVEPFTDPEVVPGYSELIAFNTDGCRTLLTSFPDVANMSEKTIRYKEHYDFMCKLKEGGFFDKEHTKNTAEVMLPHWKLESCEDDFTLMQIQLGYADKKVGYSLFTMNKDGVPSMARATGYTCNAAVNLITSGNITEPGLYLPEEIGKAHLPFISRYLADRGVTIMRH